MDYGRKPTENPGMHRDNDTLHREAKAEIQTPDLLGVMQQC